MHELIVVRFPSAEITPRITDAIQRLHADNGTKIYQAFVVAKDLRGKVSTREIVKRKHGATMAGGLIGGLAGLPFGPLAMAIGAVGGAIVGYSAELLHEGDATELVQKISRDLTTGQAFAVVEVAEGGLEQFAAHVERSGGTVLRK
jgi:uncharacterized membrane protein